MSRNAEVTFDFGDGTHTFRLAIGQLRELQEKLNTVRARIGAPLIGPQALYEELRSTNVWPQDVGEIIRLGLIGGGMKPVEAFQLVQRYVYERPLAESSVAALLILGAALVGSPEEDIEGKGEAADRTISPSSSPLTTETGPSVDSPHSKLMQ